MRALLAALALATAVLAVPAPAQAFPTCDWDDVVCLADCLATTGGPCGWQQPPDPLATQPCGAGGLGSVLVVLGHPVAACVSAGAGPCPEGFTGVVVTLNGQPHGLCVQ
jgi:hypothetical protein